MILGVGMCLAIKVIGNGSVLMMALGIIIGCVGILGVSINYPNRLEYFTRGVVGIVNKWLELNCEMPIEKVVQLIIDCVGFGIKN